jgi:hypothetical protein
MKKLALIGLVMCLSVPALSGVRVNHAQVGLATQTAKNDVSGAVIALFKTTLNPSQKCYYVGLLRSSTTTAILLNVDFQTIDAVKNNNLNEGMLNKLVESYLNECRDGGSSN